MMNSFDVSIHVEETNLIDLNELHEALMEYQDIVDRK